MDPTGEKENDWKGHGLIFLILFAITVSFVCTLPALAAQKKQKQQSKQKTASDQKQRSKSEQGTPKTQQMRKGYRIIGWKVRNIQDEEIGKIEDLVVSKAGSVIYAILGVGGFLGIGEKKIAVPYESLEMVEEGYMKYLVTREELQRCHRTYIEPLRRRIEDRRLSFDSHIRVSGSGTTGTAFKMLDQERLSSRLGGVLFVQP